jgi:hypothetical protein
MTVSVRQLTGAVVVSFCVGAFISPVGTQVQGTAKPAQAPPAAAEQATYMEVEFMKVPDGKEESCRQRVVDGERLPAPRARPVFSGSHEGSRDTRRAESCGC